MISSELFTVVINTATITGLITMSELSEAVEVAVIRWGYNFFIPFMKNFNFIIILIKFIIYFK
jgi:hypothetical protein